MSYKILSIILALLMVICLPTVAQSSDNYEKALQSFNLQKNNDAYIHLKNALQENPANLAAKLLLGKILVIQREEDAAIDELHEAIELGADLNLITVTLAKAYMLKKNYVKVIDLPFVALTTKNKFELFLLQAAAWQNLKNPDNAFEKYNHALALQPDNIKVVNSLALFYIQQGNIKKAQELALKLVEINPDDPLTLHFQGLLHQQANEIELALVFFERAYKSSSSDPFISRSLANIYIGLKNYDKARVIINDILKDTSDDPFIMLLNARLFSINDENELADEAYNSLIQKLTLLPGTVFEDLPELQYVSGLADYMMGNYEKARKQLQIYLANEKDSIKTIVMLVDIYIKQDETYKAAQFLEDKILITEQNLSLSLMLCNLYIKDKKVHKCELFISDLRKIHGDIKSLDLMQIKTLQHFKKYPEALALFKAKVADNSEEKIKKMAAILYIQNKQDAKALEIVDELLAIAPENINYQLLKSDILIDLQQTDEAQSIVDNILRIQPDSLQAKFNQAELHFLKGEFFQSQKYAEKLIITEPQSFRLYVLLGNSFFGQDKMDSALDAFFKARRLAGGSPIPSEQIVKIYRLTGKSDLAIDELERLSKDYFLKPKYIQAKAEIYAFQNKLTEAAQEYRILFSLWNDNHQLLLTLGQMQRQAKLFIDSEKSILKSLEISPDFLYSKIELMRLYVTQGKISDAEVLFNTLLVTETNNANVQLIAADIAYTKKQFIKAQKHYFKALDLNNNYSLAAIKLYQLAKNNNIGNRSFEKIMNGIIDRHSQSYFHRNLFADYFFSIGKKNKAKEHYFILEKVEDLPNKKYVYNNLANIYLEENLEKALGFVDKAIELDATNSSFFDTKGWILSQQKNYKLGLNFLRQAFSMDANNPSNRYHIAYTLVKLGRKKEAIMELEVALESNENFTEKKLAQQLLNSL